MSKGLALPEGVELTDLSSNYNVCANEYSRAFKRMRMLDMTDKNKLWESINAAFPVYQILPETNHVSYVKNNILASIYTVGKSAKLLPTAKEDKDIIENLNAALEHIWAQLKVPYYQMLAGERAALLNLGVTQVGWDNNVVAGSGDSFYKGRCKLKNINPLKYMRDPYADSIETAAYAMTWDDYHKSVIKANKNYREAFAKYLIEHNGGGNSGSGLTPEPNSDIVTNGLATKKDYYRVYTQWVRVDEKIHEIHTINNEYVLYIKEDIQPNTIPIAELYCNLPSNEVIGCSEPNKIFANTLAYNLMNSTILTAEYRNQRPPKFINSQSGLNVATFTKHGNEADMTFVVNGDASKAVHYHQFPQPSGAAIGAMGVLAADIQSVTGIDGRYTGRDTGSVLTTGGINSMLDQVTMIDAPKIENYEIYAKRLSELIIGNYIRFSAMERNYLVRDQHNPKVWKTVTIDFPSIDNDTIFEYELAISSELPKNKSIIQEMANKLMQMQMQYQGAGIDVDLITPEEWLMFQDIPMKEYMLERMGVQKVTNWTEVVAQVVNQYAGLVEAGADPKSAILATADTIANQNNPQQVAQGLMDGGMLQG